MPHCRVRATLTLLLAGLPLFPLAAHAAQTVDGWLTAVWVDPEASEAPPEAVQYWLNVRDGSRLRLELPAAQRGAALRLDRQPVRVRGEPAPLAAERPGRAPPAAVFRVEAVQAAPAGSDVGAVAPEAYSPTLGRRPWVSVMCKFADRADYEPRDESYFAAMFASTRPGLDYYWKELSNGQFSVAGSAASGWHTLPQPQSYYVYDFGNGSVSVDVQRVLDDCTAVADEHVYFPDYAGINLILNGSLGCCAWGGAGVVDRDGVARLYGVTWMPEWGWLNHTVFGHEMGHGLGLHHSRGNNQTYRNLWDVMSDIWYRCDLAQDSLLGCLGHHTIAFHKDRMGWIPDAARYVAAPGTRNTIRLDRLERPATGLYQMARIPIRGSDSRFYTVEARRKYGFDVRLPGASVVIHEVNTANIEAANVVDGDGDGDPYDAGTRWLVGETFDDPHTGVSVSVDATDGAAGFLVTIENRDGHLFSDGFESGDVSRWSGGKLDGGDFAVSTEAALGGAWGARVLIDDNNQVHITDHTPTAEIGYVARFRFSTNSLSMADSDQFTIFGAYGDSALTAVVEMRRNSGWFQLRALTRLDDGTRLASQWVFIQGGAVHEVELEWHAASGPGTADGALRLLIDRSLFADYTDLDNDTVRVERGLLGAVTGVDSGTRGSLYFDEFESWRW